MDELYIPIIVLTNETEEGDLYYAGSKKDLTCDLENNSFVEFYAKTKDGNGSTALMIRSDDISIIEVDDQSVLQSRNTYKPKVETKIIDFTNALEKIGEKTQEKMKAEQKEEQKEAPEDQPANGKRKLWKNADFVAVSRKLKSVLKSEFPHNDTAEKLYCDLIGVTMDAADAVAFFMDSNGNEKDNQVIAYFAGEAIRSWIQSMKFNADAIVAAANDKTLRDYILDDVFTTTLDSIEKSTKA